MHPDLEAAQYELLGLLDQLAPGSPSSTKRALDLVPNREGIQRVLELGCGTGAATLSLAENLDAELIAVDLHAPYIERLRERAAERGLAARITARVADMREPGVQGPFDLIWAEGSIYMIGFAEGCAMCRDLLVPGGALAVTELAWVRDDPPAEVRRYWADHYPKIRPRERLRDDLVTLGFEIQGEFALPRADWERYYALVRRQLEDFERRRDDPAARTVCLVARQELEVFERFGDSYGYVFFVATKP
jgi:cyclopropane fatty-acyl-phospholipid synthase-like methyltransferase